MSNFRITRDNRNNLVIVFVQTSRLHIVRDTGRRALTDSSRWLWMRVNLDECARSDFIYSFQMTTSDHLSPYAGDPMWPVYHLMTGDLHCSGSRWTCWWRGGGLISSSALGLLAPFSTTARRVVLLGEPDRVATSGAGGHLRRRPNVTIPSPHDRGHSVRQTTLGMLATGRGPYLQLRTRPAYSL